MSKQKITLILILAMFSITNVVAQQMKNPVYGSSKVKAENITKPTDSELDKFVKAVKQVNETENEYNDKFIEKLQKSGLTLERFNQLRLEYQETGSIDAADSEKENFEAIINELTQSQKNMETKLQNAVVSNGLELERYQEIMAYVSNSPEMQEKVKSRLME